MSNNIVQYEVGKEIVDPLQTLQIGDWCWVLTMDHDWDDFVEDKADRDLWCVSRIGSNFVKFSANSDDGRGTCSFRLHFDFFNSRCVVEPAWREIFEERRLETQKLIKEKTQELLTEGRGLNLLNEPRREQSEGESLLPTVIVMDPNKYKKELIEFNEERMPAIKKEIEELAVDYAVVCQNMALPDEVRLDSIKVALETVHDKIFTVELYCGLQEQVHQINEGEPASVDEPITIRQQMLFMDEETLFDYDDGGMNFEKLEDFDKWVVKNVDRILPEPKGIVAFRVRRHKKDYGRSYTISDALMKIGFAEEDFKTYLLIRNGERMYRIASSVNFSPRLLPFKDEIGASQFEKERDRPFGTKIDHKKKVDIVTPDDVDYDDHVAKMDSKIKHYNRAIILIQGLLDRSKVFHPHPGIKLTCNDHIDKWIHPVRDEEKGLPNNKVTYKEYAEALNGSLKKGKMVYSVWDDLAGGSRYYGGKYYYSVQEEEVANRPLICEIFSMKRDKSQVQIHWYTSRTVWGYYNDYGNWVETHEKQIHRYYWIPVEHVVNIDEYTLGDYKMFLCDRALNGEYLEWAPILLRAEEYHRKKEKDANTNNSK